MPRAFWRRLFRIQGPAGPEGYPGPDTIGPSGESVLGPRGPMPRHEWRGTALRFETEAGWSPWIDFQGPPG